MKICFVHEEYPRETNFGGIATYQKIMAEYYANHGDKVYVVSRGCKDMEYFENGVHVFRVASDNNPNDIDSIKEYRMKIAKILKKLQDANEIDIIETPDWGANTIYFEKYRTIPLVIRLHTPLKIWLEYNNNDFGESKDLILNWEGQMLNNANVITACSKLIKNAVVKQYNINNNIIVIPNPYNGADFRVDSTKENTNLIYVGSLEQRKGVLLLAQALNEVMDKFRDNIIYIVEKDTKRNIRNISSKKCMLEMIDKKYHYRVKFIGQVDNDRVNYYLNKSCVAIFPSIFDNYPYTILEAMASGKHIVCSDNIGSVDLVSKNNYVFKSNNYNDLSKKIMQLLSDKKDYINYDNIKIVKFNCNQNRICNRMKKIYEKAILDYKEIQGKTEAIQAFNRLFKNINIKSIKKLNRNLANIVYVATTQTAKYIIKKYNYNYDFDLCNELYDIYEKNDIKIIRPINDNVIIINNNKYNIFHYVNHGDGIIIDDFIVKLVNLDRKTTKKPNLLAKCDKYYNYLTGLANRNYITAKDEIFVINEYKRLKNMSLFNEQYLNHGDLSYANIIFNRGTPYIIDFDETLITTKLYDFAVMFIKVKINDKNIDSKEMLSVVKRLLPDYNYDINDYLNTIKLYLCKILLEKFYLFEKNKIDLFSRIQLNDNYQKYIKMLKEIKKCRRQKWKK